VAVVDEEVVAAFVPDYDVVVAVVDAAAEEVDRSYLAHENLAARTAYVAQELNPALLLA
jgi:hypothetical protein